MRAPILTKCLGVFASGNWKSSTAMPSESVIKFHRKPRNLTSSSPCLTGGSPTSVGCENFHLVNSNPPRAIADCISSTYFRYSSGVFFPPLPSST